MTSPGPKTVRATRISVACAALWSAGLIALAFLPTYGTSTVTESATSSGSGDRVARTAPTVSWS